MYPSQRFFATLLGAAGLAGPAAVAHADSYRIVYSFDGGGDTPISGLLKDNAGNLYGATARGGVWSYGALFKLAPDGGESVLHSFKWYDEGGEPQATPTRDAAGNFYGTAQTGGAYPAYEGTVYKIAPDGAFTVLHSFAAGAGGEQPIGGVILHRGDLYGTTSQGGDPVCGCGVVFRLSAQRGKLYRAAHLHR